MCRTVACWCVRRTRWFSSTPVWARPSTRSVEPAASCGRSSSGLSPFAAGPAREQLPPLEGVLEQISEEVEVTDGVRLVPAPGHTRAHLAVEVGESGGLLFAVDALLHPLQVRRPDWGHGLDHDAAAAVATRRALLARAAERGHVIAASHWDDVVAP